jgi:hypothetical protein
VGFGSSFDRVFLRPFLVSAQDRFVDCKEPQATLQSGKVKTRYLYLYQAVHYIFESHDPVLSYIMPNRDNNNNKTIK